MRKRFSYIIIFGSVILSCSKKIPIFSFSENTKKALSILEPNLQIKLGQAKVFTDNSICEIYRFVHTIDTCKEISNSKYSQDLKTLIYSDIQSYFGKNKSYQEDDCYENLFNFLKTKRIYIYPKVNNSDKIIYHIKNRNWYYLKRKIIQPLPLISASIFCILIASTLFFLKVKWKRK